MPYNILDIIRGEIRDFLYNDIEPVPGWSFNQYNTIKRCYLALASQFEDKGLYQGREKFYDQKIKPKRDRIAAFLNIDTKDIRVISTGGDTDPFKLLVANKETQQYMKETDLSQKLNDMADGAVDVGSVVIKKTPEGDQIVDMRRLFNDPTVSNLQKSRFVTIKHLFTISELRKKVKDGWDKEVIENIIQWKKEQLNRGTPGTSYEGQGQENLIRSTPYIEVYERFGEVEQGFLDNPATRWNDNIVKALIIVVEPMAFSITSDADGNKSRLEYGGVLFKSKWSKEYPFDEYHYYQIPGRWLGVGPVEALLLPQERLNELANQKRISMELSTIHIFQSPDNQIVTNITTDLVSGDVIKTGQGGIAPLVNEERNLAAFASEEAKYQQSIDSISFVSPQIAGEAVPSSTPATNTVIQQNNVVSVFNFKRQNFANFIRRYMRKFVLPDLLKSISKDHVLRYVGNYEEMMKLNLAVATSFANYKAKEAMLNGQPVTEKQREEMIVRNFEQMRGKNEHFMDVVRDWYVDVQLDFDILIDNEQQSTDVIANNTWQMIQVLSAREPGPPLQNPVIRALVMDYAEKVGINPTKLESVQQLPQLPQQQSAPKLPDIQAQQPQIGQGAGNQVRVGQMA